MYFQLFVQVVIFRDGERVREQSHWHSSNIIYGCTSWSIALTHVKWTTAFVELEYFSSSHRAFCINPTFKCAYGFVNLLSKCWMLSTHFNRKQEQRCENVNVCVCVCAVHTFLCVLLHSHIGAFSVIKFDFISNFHIWKSNLCVTSSIRTMASPIYIDK